MRRKLQSLFLSITFLALALSPALAKDKKQDRLKDLQHRSMHEIVMVDRDSNGAIAGGGLCTAYAIGPHTLLTAEHCNDEYANAIYIDADREAIHRNQAMSYTVSRTFDHEDHMILDVSAVYFDAYIPLAAVVPVPVQGDHAYFWGNPSGIKDQYREGVVMGSMPFDRQKDDPEIDVDGNIVYMIQVTAVPGDSGSSIFNSKGERIAILTYGMDDGQVAGVFPIKFTQEQINTSLGDVKPEAPLVRGPYSRDRDMECFGPCTYSRTFSERGGHSAPRGGNSHSSPRGENHGSRGENHRSRGDYHGSPRAREHYHNGRFDHDYYVGHFGPGHQFYFSGVYWYGPYGAYDSIFVFDDCGFVLMNNFPPYWPIGAVYIFEVDGHYFLTSPGYPGMMIAIQVVL